MKFVCNICGTECDRPAEGFGREIESCSTCRSSVRLRALIALLSQEIFGTRLTLPEFPVLKTVHGIGMSDSPELARRLAEKFDYTNTFYHKPPLFDVTRPDESDYGSYDFILSSEVMEHVAPPVEGAFATLWRMLKPDGLLLLTTPYTVDGKTAEHFPSLHAYALVPLGGQIVLVNRRADGQLEVFENLMFHGGIGSTVEMRVFTEPSLRNLIEQAGFASIRIAAENYLEFGIEHSETWSLPIAARKGQFHLPVDELVSEYLRSRRDLAATRREYERQLLSIAKLESDLAEHKAWVAKVEGEFKERTHWAFDLEREKNEVIANFERAEKSAEEARQEGSALMLHLAQREAELDAGRAHITRLEAEVARLSSRKWTRLGRKLGLV